MSQDGTSQAGVPTHDPLTWLLRNYRHLVIERWIQRVLDDPQIPAANKLPRAALEDNLPEAIELILRELMKRFPPDDAEQIGRQVGGSEKLGPQHARHRFAANYSLRETLRELSLFRTALLEICEEVIGPIPVEQAKLLHATIDELMIVSADELEQYSLRRIEQVMAVVAHDLRNPLNSILGYAQLLESNAPLEGSELGAALTRNGNQMKRLVEDLLAIARIQRGELSIEPCCVEARPIVNCVVDQVSHFAARKNVAVVASLPEQPVEISCDPDRIEQALGNLLSNAIRFSPPGSNVRVELELLPAYATFRVIDSGPGISNELREHVFRPFWQGAHASGAGVGLGLAIARGIVEAHGGTIRVDDNPKGGSIFSFAIPTGELPRPSESFAIDRS